MSNPSKHGDYHYGEPSYTGFVALWGVVLVGIVIGGIGAALEAVLRWVA